MRAVHLALMTRSGQPGYPTILTAPRWGFYETVFGGNQFELPVPFESTVVQHTLFKIVAAEGHAMSAVEAALILSKQLGQRIDSIQSVRIRTQKPAMTIINKTGPLHNAADRDHCMKYMVAMTLLKGDWPSVHDYENDSPWATDPRVDSLRERMTMFEDPQMTFDYYNNDKYASGLTVTLEDGSTLSEVVIERPIGHWTRTETVDELQKKFLGLTNDVLQNAQGLWDLTLAEETASMRVRDWVDTVNRGCKILVQ